MNNYIQNKLLEQHICRFNDGECNCDCYISGMTDYHNHIVEKVREKRKKEDFTKTYCPECGGHYAAGECDCAGYNKAIDDFISQLQDTNK